MSEQVETRLTPRERLTRGLAYSAVGPVDVTRGLLELGVGLGLQSARSTAAGLRRRYREGRLAREVAAAQETLAQELTAAQDVVANLPQALQDARTQRRSKHHLWIFAGIAAAILAGGAVAFSIVRRSSRRGATAPLRPVVTRWGLGIRTPDPRLAQANHDADQWVTTQSTCERTQLRLTVVICNCGQSPKNRASIVACWSLT